VSTRKEGEKLLSVQEVATRLDVTPHAVRAMIKRGAFPRAEQIGKVYVIPEGDLAGVTVSKAGRPRKSRKDNEQ
jgi:predicted DNA-binding transcriptional regulator AlpA